MYMDRRYLQESMLGTVPWVGLIKTKCVDYNSYKSWIGLSKEHCQIECLTACWGTLETHTSTRVAHVIDRG